MKRIISILLAVLMLLTCLSAMASCSQKTKTEEKSEEKTAEKTSEASSSTKGKAPASTAPTTTKKPAPNTTVETAPVESAPKPTAPQVTVSTSTPSSQLPEDLKAISAIAIPNDLIGTTWSFVKADYNGTELGVDEMGRAAIEFLNSTSVSLIDEAGSEACSLTIDRSARYLSFSNDNASFYGVFTVKSGVTTLAIASPEQSGLVLYFEEGAEAILPSDPEVPSNSKNPSDSDVPEFLASYLSIAEPLPSLNGTTWTLIGGVNGGEELSDEEADAMGLSVSFRGSQATFAIADKSNSISVEINDMYFYLAGNGLEFYGIAVSDGVDNALFLVSPNYEGDYLILCQE